jgi:hypothetical protein
MTGGHVIQDPFSEEYFWFDPSEVDSDPLDSFDHFDLDSARDNWGWDEWGDLCVFRPQGYEPAYRYPLLVWLTLDETPDQALRDWFPDISERNYVAAGVQIRRFDSVAQNRDRLVASIREVAALYGVHPSRIWIAGQGAAADWALRLLPSIAKFVQGVIAVTPRNLDPAEQQSASAARGKELFVVTDRHQADLAQALTEYWEIGGGQGRCLTIDAVAASRLVICRALNDWLMQQVCSPAAS